MRDQRATGSTAITQQQCGFRRVVAAFLMACLCVYGVAACGQGDADSLTGGAGTGGALSGDLRGGIGTELSVGDAIITVEALQDAFQPAAPVQRLSDDTPAAPAAGESFYQAYVRLENRGQFPLRVDPEDFVCLIGNTVAIIEPTRSGPPARSIIFGTSLDVVLTFKGGAGLEPTLIYSPPWYDGDISFSAGGPSGSGGTTTTGATTTSSTLSQ